VSTYASGAHGAASSVYGQKSSWNAHAAKPKFTHSHSVNALPELSAAETSQIPLGGASLASLGGGLKQLSSVNAMGGAAAGGGGVTGSFARRHYRRKKEGSSIAVGGGLTSLPMPSAMKKL
jgi:hypothetical protein